MGREEVRGLVVVVMFLAIQAGTASPTLGRVVSEARLLFYLNSFSSGAWVRTRLCGRRALSVHLAGLRALDLYRVCQIADRRDVSVDWLLGRSDVMDIPREGTRVA